MSNSSKFVCELSTSKNAHWSESNAVINWTTTEVYRNRNGDSSFNRKCQRATFPDRHAWFGHLFKSIRFNWKYYCRKFWVRVIRYRQIFSGGVSDQNENLVGRKLKIGQKIFCAPPAHEKGVPKFFACGGLFSSWRHWKQLKTDKNR